MKKTERNLIKGFKKYYLSITERVSPEVRLRQLGIIQNNLENTLANTNLTEHNTRSTKARIQAIKQLRTELLINAAT